MYGQALVTVSLLLLQVTEAAPAGFWGSGSALKSHNHMPFDRFFHEQVTRHTTVTVYASTTTTIYAPDATPVAQVSGDKPSGSPAAVPPVVSPAVASGLVESSQTAAIASPNVQVPAAAPAAPKISAITSPLAATTTVRPAPVVAASSTPQPAASSAAPALQAAAVNSNAGTVEAGGITVDIIKAIMPSAASCANAPFPSECRTADQAAPLFAQSFSEYNINSKAAQAAVLALVALESGELKYNKAHYGDVVAGKGTRNMQYPNFNQKYASDVLGASAIAGKDAASILTALQANDAIDFGSAAWFLRTQCPTVLQQFSTNPSAAWTAYLGPSCIGTTETAQRDGYWTAAKKALGVS